VKQELKQHLLPLLALFLITSLFWILNQVYFPQFIYLFFGFFWGSFILDTDHLIYWFFINPNIEESKLAQFAFKKKDFTSLLRLLESTHKGHTSLIFHHYFFQAILALFSFFIFTSSNNVFVMAFILAINVHLLVDQITDYQKDPKHLQNWLFAREKKQLPVTSLKYYLGTFTLLTLLFFFFLIRSQL